MTLFIRHETAEDQSSIYAVTEQAFRDMPHAGGDEQDIVDRLRDAGGLALSLVAEERSDIVGHVAFSEAKSSDGDWYALGPVSVLPDRQRRGIGSALIRQGLDTLKRRGATGCVLVGEPEYYKRFGFRLAPKHSPSEDFASHFMVLAFDKHVPSGAIHFHPAFFE